MKASEIIEFFLAAADAFNGPIRCVRPYWMADDAQLNEDIARLERDRARRLELYGPPLPRRQAAVSAHALLEHVTHLELTRLQTVADSARRTYRATLDRATLAGKSTDRAYRTYETTRDAVEAYREEITRLRARIEQWAGEAT